jgi:hypothetical protein
LKTRAILILFLSAFISAPLFASQEIALLPYAVETITADFPADSGDDYAKLMGIAAAIGKNLSVYPYKTMKQDLSKLALDPQGTITREDLALFCKSRYLSYAVAGRISHTGKGYESSSVLYSAERDTVVGSVHVSARTLPELAALEAQKLFMSLADRREKDIKKTLDIAVVIDTSYSASREWADIKKGIESLAVDLFDAWPGSRLHIIPFAQGFTLHGTPDPCETVPAVRERMSAFSLKGGSTGRAVSDAFSFAVENIPWQNGSERSLLIVTNAPLERASLERTASRAKARHIQVSVLTLGSVDFNDSTLYKRISTIGAGRFASVSYRQRVTDNRGNDYYLFMERGRLFESDSETAEWKDGLLRSSGSGSEYLQTPSFADEVSVVKSEYAVTPYAMTKYYTHKGSRSVLGTGALETNCGGLLSRVADSVVGTKSASSPKRPLARVLLSQGKVSIWTTVTDPEDLAFFSDRKELGFVFPLGIRLSVRADEPLGFTFNPDCYYTGYDWDNLPDSLRMSLSDMAAAPAKYASKGLLSPPVWFVNVKVEEVERKGKRGDIRGD